MHGGERDRAEAALSALAPARAPSASGVSRLPGQRGRSGGQRGRRGGWRRGHGARRGSAGGQYQLPARPPRLPLASRGRQPLFTLRPEPPVPLTPPADSGSASRAQRPQRRVLAAPPQAGVLKLCDSRSFKRAPSLLLLWALQKHAGC